MAIKEMNGGVAIGSDQEVKSLTFLQKFMGIISSPSKTFKSICRLPDNKIPLLNAFLIIFFTSLSYYALSAHIMVNGSPSFINAFNIYLLGSFIGVILVNSLSIFIVWFVIAFAYWMVGKYFFVKRHYSDALKIIVHCFIPLTFSRIFLLGGLYIGLTNISIVEGQSIAAIQAELETLFNSGVWLVYDIFDTFTWLWCALIISFALKEFYRIDLKKGLITSYSIIAVYLFLSLLAR